MEFFGKGCYWLKGLEFREYWTEAYDIALCILLTVATKSCILTDDWMYVYRIVHQCIL